VRHRHVWRLDAIAAGQFRLLTRQVTQHARCLSRHPAVAGHGDRTVSFISRSPARRWLDARSRLHRVA
jgi:hypothetical protein